VLACGPLFSMLGGRCGCDKLPSRLPSNFAYKEYSEVAGIRRDKHPHKVARRLHKPARIGMRYHPL
jgi:hypothetical protein